MAHKEPDTNLAKDQAFIEWYDGPFQAMLERSKVPGMADASWDRRAAWLLWEYGRSQASFVAYVNWAMTRKDE